MKTKIILPLILSFLSALVLLLYLDFNIYKARSKTIPCEESGIIFSITTFDGDTESEPFIKCLGHTWVSIDNRTGHSIYLKDHEVKNDEMLTFSVWAISGHKGVVFNLEPDFALNYGRYVGRQSLSTNISEQQLMTIENYIDRNDGWTLGKNCSYWSIHLWNELVNDEYKLKTQNFVYSPKRLLKSLGEYDCVETDKDFQRASGTFFYQDGSRTELKLCS